MSKVKILGTYVTIAKNAKFRKNLSNHLNILCEMKFSDVLGLRRIINSSYHPFHVIPKPSKWIRRERLMRLTAVGIPLFTYKIRYLRIIYPKILEVIKNQRWALGNRKIFCWGGIRSPLILRHFRTDSKDVD